jgi:ribosome biogenesis GTPase A
MRPRYSFSSRHTGQAKNPKNVLKKKKKFPEVAQKVLEESDIILQILDARFVNDTRNPEVEEYIKNKNKQIINVLNKADLVAKKNLILPPIPYALASCKNRAGIKELRNKIKRIASKIKKQERVVVGIIGYPNTGKSSIINILIGKKSAGTGAEAGFTKGMQKLKLSQDIVLLDSPGIISKKDYNSISSAKLAQNVKVGARSYSQVKDPEQIIAELMKEFPEAIGKHYSIETDNPESLLEELGRQKHFLKKGNEINYDKTARLILKDWQAGKIKI